MTFHVIARLSAAASPRLSAPFPQSHHRRSQAHETLGTMTTIIMRTSDDNRGQLFLVLFQGFQFLGNLPISLVFHEAPTGTQK